MQGVGVDDVKSPSSPMLRVPVNMSKLAQQSDNFKKANNETKPEPAAIEHILVVLPLQLPRFWGDTQDCSFLLLCSHLEAEELQKSRICHIQSQRDVAEGYSSGILDLDLKQNFVWTQPTLQKHEISHISAGKTGFWPQGSSCMSAVVLLRSEGLPLVEVELVHSFQWVPLQKPD